MLYLYHNTPVQDLIMHDLEIRQGFCRLVNTHKKRDLNFDNNILFSDETGFARRGITNTHNKHIYWVENAHVIKVTQVTHIVPNPFGFATKL